VARGPDVVAQGCRVRHDVLLHRFLLDDPQPDRPVPLLGLHPHFLAVLDDLPVHPPLRYTLEDGAPRLLDSVLVVPDNGETARFAGPLSGESVGDEGKFAFDRGLWALRRVEFVDPEILDLAGLDAVFRHARGEQRVVLAVFAVRLLGGDARREQE